MDNRRRFPLILVLAAAVGVSGCSTADFPEYHALGGLRVLSLQATPPEIAPGESSTITPYLSDLNGAGRALVYTAVVCPDPGVSRGADPTCDGVPGRVEVAAGLTVTTLAAPNYTGAGPIFTVTAPADLLALRNPVDAQNGVVLLATFRVGTSDGSTTLKTFKRVVVSNKVSKNINPVLTAIYDSGNAPLAALPVASMDLKPEYPDSSVETYTLLAPMARA